MKYAAQVYLTYNAEPLLVFARGARSGKYHAIEAGSTIRLVQVDTLRGLREATYKGEPYPPKRAASFWLNRSTREITKRAKLILKALVARKQQAVLA